MILLIVWHGMDLHAWLPEIAAAGLLLLHGVGAGHAVHALLKVRSSQGAIAWIVSLIAAPWIAIPLYWVAGRSRFSGYVHARREEDAVLGKVCTEMQDKLEPLCLPTRDAFGKAAKVLSGVPFTRGNSLDLLIDGQETFHAIFDAIARAQHYVLASFYIVKNDRLGGFFQKALIQKAREGVAIYFLFDEIGSHKLQRRYLRELKAAGVKCHYFGTNRLIFSRLQINFRNHRKIVVVDGEEAFIGGLNVGDEYLGRDQRYGGWRDTHLQLKGPSVQAIQLAFIEDWYWACEEVPDLHWEAPPQEADQAVAILPTGPADPADSWQLAVVESANTARQKLWIASPYFVPDGGVLAALQTAAIRGVDVRILIPEKADHLLVWLSAFSYYDQTIPYGIKIYRYQKGFLHQKVMLVDDVLATVGTANLDNRSFRLNFEITALSSDARFISEIHEMLKEDFKNARLVKMAEYRARPFLFRLACQAARLMSPVQ
jgi:cardiolipin synthase A/B